MVQRDSGAIQAHTRLRQLVDPHRSLPQSLLNGPPALVVTQIAQHISQTVIVEILNRQGLSYHPLERFKAFGDPWFNINHEMVGLRKDKCQPGENCVPHTQALPTPMGFDGCIDNLSDAHFVVLLNQQRNAIYSFALYFNFCHNVRCIPVFCF